MLDIEDLVLYGFGALGTAAISKTLEAFGKIKQARAVDLIFYIGSAGLFVIQLDDVFDKVIDVKNSISNIRSGL